MTLVNAVENNSSVRLAARGLQVVLVGLIGYGAITENSGLLINGVLALPIVLSPALLEWRYDHEVDPRLTLRTTAAAVVPVACVLGPYDILSGFLSWYD
jgi:hypothetical protein